MKNYKSKLEQRAERLVEDFETKRFDAGQVKFSKTQFNDAHVKKIIAHASQTSGVPEAEIIDKITAEIKKFDDIATKAPTLYATIQENIVESEVFKLLKSEKSRVTKAPQFNVTTFYKLIRYIKTEHDQFFPLRNFIDHQYLYNPRIIVTPSPLFTQYKDIKTAAATKKGDFIFYKPFMQQLLDFAHMKVLAPKGKKYENNGGDIPPEYAYIEFLVIHEFMHYTYADFHYQKILKAKGKIINWVGDFRTNYLLVKSGFEQLPMGLFNDHINYDRQKSYKEMYDITKAEFDKLSAAQKKQVSSKLDDMGDDHSDNKKQLKEGQMVRMPNGKFGKVEKVNPDGTADVRDFTKEEQADFDKKIQDTGLVKG